jgi:hemerythrin-like domain-containing protein
MGLSWDHRLANFLMGTKATDALLKDHLLINKILEQFQIDNPRFEKICLTLHRAVKAHAWFEDEIFLPAVQAEPLLFRRFTDEIYQEHKDIDALAKLLRKTPMAKKREVLFYSQELRVLLSTHFKKEEDALFPLAEHLLTEEGLIELGDEMKRRQTEVRQFLEM